jgi:5'/3'-nucleotidase SurE
MPPTVLLTNDDGPPGAESPYVYGLYRHLTKHLGWDVKVVLPSTQKSWIGKGFQITQIVRGSYYYPKDPDGYGDVSPTSRPLKDGEVGEWILLDGTPATCANVALHNIFHEQIDLLISGPNLGRNTSAAFSLSSGTVGAALSSSLSKIRSIAISYGTVIHPTPTTLFPPAHILGAGIINYLWRHWGNDIGGLREGEVDLYNVNIPLIAGLLDEQGLEVCWTRMWRNSYGRLFKAISASGALQADLINSQAGLEGSVSEEIGELLFRFAPDMNNLVYPEFSSLPVGSDTWAISKGWASVTPLRASFAEPELLDEDMFIGNAEDRVWKMKL